MFLIVFRIFLVTCGCWGVAGLADEKDENRLYAHVLDHHARSWSRQAGSGAAHRMENLAAQRDAP